MTRTHLGLLQMGDRVVEPTGRASKVRMAARFEFAPGSDLIARERPYYDQAMVLKALGLI